MKKCFWMAAGVCAAVAGFLVWNPCKEKRVQDLANSLQEAWADHHTTV